MISVYLGVTSGNLLSDNNLTDDELLAMEYYWDDNDANIEKFWSEEE